MLYSDSETDSAPIIGAVIPCFKVIPMIDGVLQGMPSFIDKIYCVDDKCPEDSGRYIQNNHQDPRIHVLFHQENLGVGGAVQTGYEKALEDGVDIIIKIDGDGQMDPRLAMEFARPIIDGDADYTKGNRFFWVQDTQKMPKIRIFGNGILSFLTKMSTGYWNVFDPTNGYTAIHARVLRKLPFKYVSKNYFFESDMLFHLSIVRAVVQDVPMTAVYDEEESNLSIRKVLTPFLKGHFRNLAKRVLYMYYLRDFHLASLELLLGFLSLTFGVGFSAFKWYSSIASGIPTTAGTVMIGALTILVGIQMLLGAANFDIQNVPRTPIHPQLKKK